MEVTCYIQSFDVYFLACEVYFNLQLDFYLIHICLHVQCGLCNCEILIVTFKGLFVMFSPIMMYYS